MAIIVMNDGTVFDYDHDYGNVIRTEETKCRKVCFDLSRLKKKEKIYSEWGLLIFALYFTGINGCKPCA